MPQDVVKRLERLIQVKFLDEMEDKMREAEVWYYELHEELYSK
jgi:hypothetical protein